MTQEIKGKAKEPKSNTPLLIIGGVLVVALVGAWYLYSTSKPATANSDNTASANKTAPTPKDNKVIPPNAPPGAQPPNMVGSATASVVLEEFADFQCGSCAAAHPIMNEIKSLYGSRIKFTYRNNPLSIPAHDKAYEASVAAEAAGMQGKFWDMQNLLFTNQQAWTAAPTYKAIWKDYAGKIGMDVPKWESDMAGIAAKGRVDADLARGKAIGVNSTPTLFINGNSVPFSEMTVPKLKVIIDGEIAKATGANAQPAGAAPASNAAPAANASK